MSIVLPNCVFVSELAQEKRFLKSCVQAMYTFGTTAENFEMKHMYDTIFITPTFVAFLES